MLLHRRVRRGHGGLLQIHRHVVELLGRRHLLAPLGERLLVLARAGDVIAVLGHERLVFHLVGHRIEVLIQPRDLVLHRQHEGVGQLVGQRHVEAGEIVGLDEVLQLLGVEDVRGVAAHEEVAGVHEAVGVRLARARVEIAHGMAEQVGVVGKRLVHRLVLTEVAHDGVGGAGAVVLARGQLHGVAVVGALDAEQVVVRRLSQRGVAGGGFQNSLGDHDRRVQVVLGGDGTGRLAHQRDELLGGEVLAVVARHVGRVVDVREGDGRHRDGHLLEGRLGLALDDGGRVRLVRDAAGVAGPLLAGIDRVIRIDDRLVRFRRLLGIGRIGRIDGIHWLGRIDRIGRLRWVGRLGRISGLDRINRITRFGRLYGLNRIGRLRRINGIGRVDRSSRILWIVRISRHLGNDRLLHIRRFRLRRRLCRLLRFRRGLHRSGNRLGLRLRNRRHLGLRHRRLIIDRKAPQLGALRLGQAAELVGMTRHIVNARLIEGLAFFDPDKRFLVIGRNVMIPVVLNRVPVAVVGITGGVRCGHAAHRGND